MPTPTKGPRLGGSPAHERLILANLATALFEHGGITTTVAKAKRLRPLAERLVTFAKRGDLAARRRVLRTVRDKSVVHTLFTEIGPSYSSRDGGYTRIVKLGPRKGDNAPMARIELVEATTAAQSVVDEAERSRGTTFSRRRPVGGRTRETAEDLANESETAAAVAAEAADAAAADDEAAGIPGEGAEVEEPDETGTPNPVPDEGEIPQVEPAEDGAGDIVQDLTGGSATAESSGETITDTTPVEGAEGPEGAGEPGDGFTGSGGGNQAEQASEEEQAEGER